MKFKVTFKDPDSLQDQLADAVKADVAKLGLSEAEADAVYEVRYDAASELCSRWFEYGEYLTVEIDTDDKTCVVASMK